MVLTLQRIEQLSFFVLYVETWNSCWIPYIWNMYFISNCCHLHVFCLKIWRIHLRSFMKEKKKQQSNNISFEKIKSTISLFLQSFNKKPPNFGTTSSLEVSTSGGHIVTQNVYYPFDKHFNLKKLKNSIFFNYFRWRTEVMTINLKCFFSYLIVAIYDPW